MKIKFVLILLLGLVGTLSAFADNSTPVAVQELQTGFSLISVLRGLFGLALLLAMGFVLSKNRRSINWRAIFYALLIQFAIAMMVLNLPFIQVFFEYLGKVFIKILDSSNAGSEFLFKGLSTGKVADGMINFAFRILPTIIFFSALTSVLFYYGIIQAVVRFMAWLLSKALKLSGSESLAATSNIFLGQTEAPFLIKEYLPKMNLSELMLVMVAGMATIAGGVMAIYIGLLGGTDPASQVLFAKHLITASVMAAPGAVVAAKLLVPQTEPIESEIKVTKEQVGTNILDAIANGTGQGLRLAVNVAAMLLVFLAFIYLINFILQVIGGWTTLNDVISARSGGRYDSLSLQFILGIVFAPLVWLLGVPTADMALVGQLFGEKIILNEMVAYVSLKELINLNSFQDQKSIIMVTYMLCGFANFASVGIQIGGIGAIAPNQRTNLAKLGFRALVGGAMASLISAAMIGIFIK